MELKWNENGLIPAVAQDADTGRVLMLAWMNAESLEQTLQTGYATYYSRSRKSLWRKGETSGNTQRVREVLADCDADALLLRVDQTGPACHTGAATCFANPVDGRRDAEGGVPYAETNRTEGPGEGVGILASLAEVIRDRRANPKEGSYTNYLFDKGVDKVCKKVGEEATEVVIAAKNASREELRWEIADLIYHVMVLMELEGLTWGDIFTELEGRKK